MFNKLRPAKCGPQFWDPEKVRLAERWLRVSINQSPRLTQISVPLCEEVQVSGCV